MFRRRYYKCLTFYFGTTVTDNTKIAEEFNEMCQEAAEPTKYGYINREELHSGINNRTST